jgi:predicted PhzF superfamily epimerase YddE/YHI9
MRSRQGVAMGRPSWVHVSVETEGDAITRVRVGGGASPVGGGIITLP